MSDEMGEMDTRNTAIMESVFSPNNLVTKAKMLEAMRKAVEAAAPPPHAPWRDMPITAGLLADIFDTYCGADGHNIVVRAVYSHFGLKTNG